VLEGQADPFHPSRNGGEQMNIVAVRADSSISPTNPGPSKENEVTRPTLNRSAHVSSLPDLKLTPKFMLVLALMCREMESNGISKTLSVFIECLPVYESSSSSRLNKTEAPNEYGNMVDIPDLIKQTNSTSQKLLNAYVEMNSSKIAAMLRKGIDTPDWLNMKEPR
jgi:hypothetical protein